eukprot:6188757-Pleurochrysis_carterae.AAC.1
MILCFRILALAVCPKTAYKMYYLSQNRVRSRIGCLGGKGNGESTRRAVQTPKCIRARPSSLLSFSPIPTEAEVY